MSSIFVTRKIPVPGIALLEDSGHKVVISEKDGVLTKQELMTALSKDSYDAILSQLTDTIDAEVFSCAPKLQVVANYAVGFNNIDLSEAKRRNILVTNTPGVLTQTVAEYTIALMLAVAKRIPESEVYLRSGKYDGWAPKLFLGTDLAGKTLAIVGAGRIGYEVAKKAFHGFDMKIAYYDIKPLPILESEMNATYYETVEGVLEVADIVSLHVPLLPETTHLINKERLSRMKKDAILINTSRGPVVDERALAEALEGRLIFGAGLDVFENEPQVDSLLLQQSHVVVTPHIASASKETRDAMSLIAAENILDVLNGKTPKYVVDA